MCFILVCVANAVGYVLGLAGFYGYDNGIEYCTFSDAG